jgi:hypothetical protein
LTLILVSAMVVLVIVSIGALGLAITENIDIVSAFKRAIHLTFGRGKDPQSAGFAAFYYPLATFGMLFVSGALLTEIWTRARQQ